MPDTAPAVLYCSATAESLLELYEQRLGGVDDLLVAIVGDVDRETVMT